MTTTVSVGDFAGVHAPAGRAGNAGATIHFAGHLANAGELAGDLGLATDAHCDDVLAAAAQRWPDDWAARCNGVFVAAERTADGTLRLWREPSGLRNLYAHVAIDGSVLHASTLPRLMALPGAPCRIARRSLHEYLRLLDISAPHTLVAGVVAVEPGQVLVAGAAGLRAAPWPVVPAASAVVWDDHAQALAATDALLRHAVARRLQGARRPAAFLSGGVDSALLCALARELRPDTLALTVGFEGAAHDESPVAARIAAHLGLEHRVMRFSQQDLAHAFERYVAGAEQPMADPAILPTLLAFEHCAAAGHDAVIDGTGADEAMGLMPPRHVRIAVEHAARLPTPLRRALLAAVRALPPLAGHAPLLDFEHPAETMMRWHGFTRAEVQALCGEPVSFADTRFVRTFERYPRAAHFERYGALLDAMPCERLVQAQRISGAALRFPYCDAEVDRHLRQLPADFRYLPTRPKRMLRELLARYVPPVIWDAPKHGFDFPLHDFLAADNHALMRRHLDRWARPDLLAPAGVAELARRYRTGERRLAFRVWALLVLAGWLQHHDVAA